MVAFTAFFAVLLLLAVPLFDRSILGLLWRQVRRGCRVACNCSAVPGGQASVSHARSPAQFDVMYLLFNIFVYSVFTIWGQHSTLNTVRQWLSAAALTRQRALPRRQMFNAALFVIYLGGATFLVHFDAVRLRRMRHPKIHVAIGALLLLANFRVLLRERLEGKQACLRSAHARTRSQSPRRRHGTPTDETFSQDTVCILYCARLRTIVSRRPL
jgi:hypothetical protein